MTAVAEERSPIVLRACEKGDRGFIITSWAQESNGITPGDTTPMSAEDRKAIYWYHSNRAERLLNSGTAIVAAFDESPAYILGWIAFEPAGKIHFVFVRPEHRGNGVARTLLGAAGLERLTRTILGAA